MSYDSDGKREDLQKWLLTRIDRMPRERWSNRPFSTTVTGIILIDRSTNTEIAFSNLEWLGTHPKLFAIVPFEGDLK